KRSRENPWTMRLFSCSQLMEDFAWQASWGMGGAWVISEFRQILQTTYVGCYLQPLKMALLDDICRFLNFQRHRGDPGHHEHLSRHYLPAD
ncbi:hypothetical protein J9B04_22540, partial [Klebsiella pneumoniae]